MHAVIIHGTGGNPEENWFPWLAEQLRQAGAIVSVPQFPTPEGQTVEAWSAKLDAEMGELPAGTVLVGHSLGVGFILRLAERATAPLGGIYLVSGFIGEIGQPDFDPLNAPFFVDAFDWRAIRDNAGHIRVYNSDTDPYVPLSKGEELARALETELTVVHGAGHINTAAGFTEFPDLLRDIKADAESPSGASV
jgi:predicted alpha/beta hydrolase family esterase